MRWKDPEYLADQAVKIPLNWLFNHYYEALNVLFRIENSLRTFVFMVLKENKKGAWSELSIKTEDGSDTTIVAIAKRRLAQDKTFGYLGYPVSSPLMHLTSGELIRIILNEGYWPMFSSYFPASKAIVQNKLEEIGNVRNALAHFRPVKRDDVQVVKQNANQVLSGVEEVLVNIIDCRDTVPTNSQDAWYKELKTLSSPCITLEFRQSIDEKWVRLGIIYISPIVSEPYLSDSYRSYNVLSVDTPRLLRKSKAIIENVIFASEVSYVTSPTETNPTFSKTVRFLFSRDTLTQKYSELKAELDDILRQINNETDLIKVDNLARGELVQSVLVSANRAADKRWQFDLSNLRSLSREDNPPEYWAGYPAFGEQFVSHTDSFPWMPVEISNWTVPFY